MSMEALEMFPNPVNYCAQITPAVSDLNIK